MPLLGLIPKLGGLLIKIIPLLMGGISFFGKGLKGLKKKDVVKYLPYVGVGLLALFIITRTGKGITIAQISKMSSTRKRAVRIAQTLGKMYGTSKWISWWNPMKYFEDEKDAANLLGANKDILVEIGQEYEKVSGERLTTAFERYYDTDQLEFLYKKIGWEI